MLHLLRRCLNAAQGLVPRVRGGLTILGYHIVGADNDSIINLPTDTFRRQLDELRAHARVRPLDEALRALSDDSGSPIGDDRREVVLTFDDGYENFYQLVWPLLQEYQFPATLYVQVDFLERRARGPISTVDGLAALSWAQLSELAASGLVTIGSHTLSHPDLTLLRGEALRRELEVSRQILEDKLGVAVDSFCYPGGRWSRHAEQEVMRHYRTAVVRGGRTMRRGHFSPYRLERVPLRRDTTRPLVEILESSVWLEEWAASKVRRVVG